MTRAHRERWETDEGRQLVAAVLERFAAGGSVDELGVARTSGGLLDLRGFLLPVAATIGTVRVGGSVFDERVGRVELDSVRLSGIDFSGARLDGLTLTGSVIEDCVFDRAAWNEGRLFGCCVERSSFRHSQLARLGVGPVETPSRSVMRDVVFERTDLRGFAPFGLFERCRFDRVRMKGIFFDGCRFRDCVFRGRLQEHVFSAHPLERPEYEHNDMDGCDFADAELVDVAFNGLAMGNVTWPQGPAQTLFDEYPCVLANTVEYLRHDDRPDARGARAVFELALKWMHPDRRHGVVHNEELGAVAADVLPVMRRFQDQCKDAHAEALRRRARDRAAPYASEVLPNPGPRMPDA